jgi:hypothetical protein
MDYTLDEINSRIQQDPEMKQLYADDPTEFKTRATALYKRFGYNTDGSAMPLARRAVRTGARTLGLDEDISEMAASAVLPTAGTLAGLTIGAAGGPIGAAGGAMVGSAFGEELNSAVGLTDPQDATGRATALGAPLLGPLAGRVLKPGLSKGVLRTLPGTGAGLNELASEEFTAAITKGRVTKETMETFRKGLDHVPDFTIPVPSLKSLFAEESSKVGQQALQSVPGKDTYLKRLNAFIEANPDMQKGAMTSRDLMALESGFNDVKSDLPGEVWGKASGLIIREMEHALGNPKLSASTRGKVSEGLSRFKGFIAINNKYQADEAMTKAIQLDGPIIKSVNGDTGLVKFDKKAMHKFFETNAAIKKAFSPTEIQDMKDAVLDLGYISSPPTGSLSAGNAIQRFGAGGTIGWALGGGTGGALVGVGIEETLRQAVMTKTGRDITKYLAKKGQGSINALELKTMMGQAVAGATAGAVPGVTGRAESRLLSGFDNEE